MSINSIVSKHLKTYGEAFNIKRTMGPTKARKINRTIIGECLSLVAPEVIAARAENVRLRTKLRATYMVATGEGVTTKQVADQSAKETKKSFGSRVRKIIEAIKKFFVQIFRFFTNNRPKLTKALSGIETKVSEISKLDNFPTIKAVDLESIKGPLDKILAGGKGITRGYGDNVTKDKVKGSTKGINKGTTKEITSAGELKTYVKSLKSYASKFYTAENKVKQEKTKFEAGLKTAKTDKNKDNEKYYQERLKTLGVILGNFQKGYGALYKAVGAIKKVNTGSKKKAKGTATTKTAKSASAKTATAVVVED